MEKSLFDIKMILSRSIINLKKLLTNEMTAAFIKGKISNCKQNICETREEYLETYGI